MSETAAISTVPAPLPGPAPRAATPPALSDEVDLYAEANAFSEADWAGVKTTDLFGKDGFNFKDLVDIINPLQHLPVIGTVYRAVTGDELAPAPRVIGGALFGGIAGFVTSLANAVLENETGRDAGDTVLALFTGDDTSTPATVAAASSSVPAPATAPKTASVTATTATTAHNPVTASKAAAHATTSPAQPGGIDLREVLRANAAENEENPTSALIQARAAVPRSARSTASAIPNGGLQSSITLPGGKSLPIQFRSGRSTVTSAQPLKTLQQQPATAKTAKHVPAIPATPASAKSRSLQPTSASPALPRETVAAATPTEGGDREIASKMLNALDKYETLMRSRTAPSISGEI